jgi:flagellar motor switch protein FliN/FliY
MADRNDDNGSPNGGLHASQDLIDQMLQGRAEAVDAWPEDPAHAGIDTMQVDVGGVSQPPASTWGRGRATTPASSNPLAQGTSNPAAEARTPVHPVQFMPLTPIPPDGDSMQGIDLLLDVQFEVSVELGRSQMTIRDVLALRSGSVIELDRLAGDPVDILVNGTLIARGEVVVVDEKFGVRITEVISKAKRLASLA